MGYNDVLRNAYRVATVLILAGFIMLCQPLFRDLFAWGFPVLLVGVILFMILDHVPEKPAVHEEEA